MFQNLRTNSQIYVLYKTVGSPKIDIGTVVTAAKTQFNPLTMPVSFNPTKPDDTLTITVNVAGQEMVLPGVPYMSDVMDYPSKGLFVTDSKDALNAELNSFKAASVEHINSVPVHEENIKAIDKLLKDLNPDYAEIQQQKEDILELKGQVSQILSLLKETYSGTAAAHETKKKNGNENN